MDYKEPSYVVVTDIKMPFLSMVIFMVKWVIASIPAFFILSIVGALLMMLLGGMTGAMHSSGQYWIH